MKQTYEKPEVTKIDFKFEDAIAASACTADPTHTLDGNPICRNLW